MKNKLIPVAFIIVVAFSSCSSDAPATNQTTVTTTEQDTSSHHAPTLKPFEPDANWTLPTEIVSQYGPPGIVRDVVIDHNGTIWLAAWDGVISFNGTEFTNHTLKDGLSHHRVYSVMEDSKGNMWFGTMGAGAYKYDGNTFSNYSANNGMIDNIVFDLFEDASGNIWFATNKGVSKYDGKSFLNLNEEDSLMAEIYSISQDKSGNMWFGGEMGLFHYDGTHVTEVLTEKETHYSNVRDLYCDRNGVLWIGASRGLYANQIDSKGNSNIKSILPEFIGYVHADNAGNLLLTAKGIFRYNITIPSTADDAYDLMTTIVSDKNNLGVFGSREAADGTIWYGADGLHSVKDGKDVSYKKP